MARSVTTRSRQRHTRAAQVVSLTTPIYETTTFVFESAAEVQRYAEGNSDKYLYSRYANPTVEAVESTIATLEGADAARVFASGMAATAAALTSLVRLDDEVICCSAIYGGTLHLLVDVLSKFHVRTVDTERDRGLIDAHRSSGAPERHRTGRSSVPRRRPARHARVLPGSRVAPGSRHCTPPDDRIRRRRVSGARRRPPGCRPFFRPAAAVCPGGQPRRRRKLVQPAGLDVALGVVGRGAGSRRRIRGDGPSVGRLGGFPTS